MPYRILSLDGGGVRGILESIILERLLVVHPTLLDEVDVIYGTSAGGMLALALASGIGEGQPNYYSNWTAQSSKVIFEDSLLRGMTGVDGLFRAKYGNAHVTKLLENTFGSLTLGQLKKKVCVTSFQLDSDPTIDDDGAQVIDVDLNSIPEIQNGTASVGRNRPKKKGDIVDTVTRTLRSFSLSGAGVTESKESKKGKERLISPERSAQSSQSSSHAEKEGTQTLRRTKPWPFKRGLSKSSEAFTDTSKKGKEPESSSSKAESPDTSIGIEVPISRSLDSLMPKVEKGWRPRFFHNIKEENNTGFHELVRNAALFTSSAPVYFPIAPGGFVDGSITANNPAMCAVAMSIESKITPDEIVVLSFGTGTAVYSIPISNQNTDWGFSKWAFELIDIFQDSQSEVIDYQCKHILGDRYHRIQPSLPDSSFKVDKVSKIPALTKIATDYDLTETINWLNTVWKHGDKKIPRHPEYLPNLTPTHSPAHFL